MSEYFYGYDISAVLNSNEFPLTDDDDDAEKRVIQIEFPLFKTYRVVKGNKFKKKEKKIKQNTGEDTRGSISVVWHSCTNAMCKKNPNQKKNTLKKNQIRSYGFCVLCWSKKKKNPNPYNTAFTTQQQAFRKQFSLIVIE